MGVLFAAGFAIAAAVVPDQRGIVIATALIAAPVVGLGLLTIARAGRLSLRDDESSLGAISAPGRDPQLRLGRSWRTSGRLLSVVTDPTLLNTLDDLVEIRVSRSSQAAVRRDFPRKIVRRALTANS